MERRGLQFSVASMLGLVACVALNIWCFRVHAILGLIGLNVTKHVVIAQLCQAVGVNRRTPTAKEPGPPAPSQAGVIPPSANVTPS